MKKVLRLSRIDVTTLAAVKNAVTWLLFDSKEKQERVNLDYQTYWVDVTLKSEEVQDDKHVFRRHIRVNGTLEYTAAGCGARKFKVRAEFVIGATSAIGEYGWWAHELTLHHVEWPGYGEDPHVLTWPRHFGFGSDELKWFSSATLYHLHCRLRDGYTF